MTKSREKKKDGPFTRKEHPPPAQPEREEGKENREEKKAPASPTVEVLGKKGKEDCASRRSQEKRRVLSFLPGSWRKKERRKREKGGFILVLPGRRGEGRQGWLTSRGKKKEKTLTIPFE